MPFPYVLTDNTLTVLVDNKPYQTDRSNSRWEQIKESLNSDDLTSEEMIGLLTPIKAVADALSTVEGVVVDGSSVLYGDEVVNAVLTSKVLDIINEGLNVDPWLKFIANVYANPFQAARDELYLFLEKAELPITPDGCFIAYKIVKDDYTDIYSGKFDNSVGRIVVMPGGRQAVDTDRDNTCSVGLHFCSKGYLPHYGTGYGDRVMLVKINPADVVSIPSDYDNAKGRTWRYEVVGEITREEAGLRSWDAIESGYEDYEWGWSDDEESDWESYDWESNWSDEEADNEQQTVSAIETVAHGPVTADRLRAWVAEHGSLRGVARALGQSAGTVCGWGRKLGI